MATNIPIIKYREFLHISMCYISTINETYRFEIYISHAREHKLMLKNQMAFKCQGQGQTHQ